jgi:hypothetical protein
MSNNNVSSLTVSQHDDDKRSELDLENAQADVERKKLENKKYEDSWTSCCFTINRPFFQYIIQSSLLIGVTTFSCVMLATNQEPSSLYVSLLSSSIGLLIPTGYVPKKNT